jgi:hypothetical protein
MDHNLAKYAKYYYYGNIKISRSGEFTIEIDHNKRHFHGINKHMLETSYILNLGKLFKIIPKLK